MLETGLSPIEILKLYSGNATFMLMFIIALIYLWCFEKDKVKKAVLVLASVTFLVLFVFPPFAYIFMNKAGEAGTYYRFLWLVPSTIVSAYTIVRILTGIKKVYLKFLLFIPIIICIMIGGVYMYDAPVFIDSNNAYQIPDDVKDICDEIIIENREVGAVFPDEILQYPRLYSAYIVMPYGFETLQFGTGGADEIHDEMVKETIDVKTLASLCEERKLHYIILNQNRTLDDDFSKYNYEFVGHYGNYDLYKSTTAFFGQWEDYEDWLKENGNKED